MFGNEEYLRMFTELYVATMRHMQVGGRGAGLQQELRFCLHIDVAAELSGCRRNS
jgi:hypothetical protein